MENRNLLTAAPFGATAADTGEFLLGDVLVNVVFMESDGTIDANARDWTQQQKTATKAKIVEGVNWWKNTLAAQNSVHELNFQFDFTHADAPVLTGYEPINNSSQVFHSWINDFFNEVGFNQSTNFDDNILAYNNAQRVAKGTDWSFTIFVVNSPDSPNDVFAAGGFSRAFAFAGGRFVVAPSGRPASTYAHELGHIFWARDEYAGGSLYTNRRGYYNTKNTNAISGFPARAGFVQEPSIMASGQLLQTAFDTNTNAASTLEMVGWRDSDGDGIFDVLDVPLTLSGSGAYDPLTRQYRFVGASAVQTLPNKNGAGTQSDITINEVSRVQYRIDGGAWTNHTVFNANFADIDITIGPLPAGFHDIEIRTLDDKTNQPGETGVMSPVFHGNTNDPAISFDTGVQGFIYQDSNNNAQRDASDAPVVGWTVEVLSSTGQPLNTSNRIEPDAYANATDVSSITPTATLSSGGFNVLSSEVRAVTSNLSAAGSNVFGNRTSGGWQVEWSNLFAELTIELSTPVAQLKLDAIGNSANDFGRLEIFDANFQSLGRYTTDMLDNGALETMSFNRPNADIKFAVAKGHGGSAVLLDNLRFGAETVVQTDVNGAFWVQGLEAGSYQVQLSPPSGWEGTTPGGTSQLVALPAFGAVGATFGVRSQWQNSVNALDVNSDGQDSIQDLLEIISSLRTNGIGPLPSGAPGVVGPFVDVNGDGQINVADLLQVIAHLRTNIGGSEGERTLGVDTFPATDDSPATNHFSRALPLSSQAFAHSPSNNSPVNLLGAAPTLSPQQNAAARSSFTTEPQPATPSPSVALAAQAPQLLREQRAGFAVSYGVHRWKKQTSGHEQADVWEQLLTDIAADVAVSEETGPTSI